MELRLESRRVTRTLFLLVTLLLVNHLAILVVSSAWALDARPSWLKFYRAFFLVTSEGIVPTYYSVLALLLSALLLFTIARIHLRRRKETGVRGSYGHWMLLAGIFVFLAMDEGFGVHERLIRPLRRLLHTGGYLHFAWVIPYAAALVALGVYYFRFVFALPKRTRTLFLLGGGIFVTGALGLELVGGKLFAAGMAETWTYRLCSMLEESFEMYGIVIFIQGLLSQLAHELPDGKLILRIGGND